MFPIQSQYLLRICYQVSTLICAGRRSGLITLDQTLNLLIKFTSVIPTSVHHDFLTLTPFLLPLLASEKSSLIFSLYFSTMARVAAVCNVFLCASFFAAVAIDFVGDVGPQSTNITEIEWGMTELPFVPSFLMSGFRRH